MSEASAELHKQKKEAARLAIATRLRAKTVRKAASDLQPGQAAKNPVYEEENSPRSRDRDPTSSTE